MHHSALNPLHWNTPHGIHWIQSGSIGPHCMGSTAFNQVPLGHVAWNPQHSIGIHCTMLHGIYPIQDGYICQNSWNPLHSLEMHFTSLHRIQCIQSCCIESTAFTQDPFHNAALTPLHWILMHGIHCIQLVSVTQCCRESNAFNRYPLPHSEWIPLHPTWINCPTLHAIHCIHSGCISQRFMESSAFNHATWNPQH